MVLVKVFIKLKKGILDPQGKAVKNALDSLQFTGVEDVRVGKYIELNMEDSNIEELKRKVDEMCQKFLANPIIEDYSFEIE